MLLFSCFVNRVKLSCQFQVYSHRLSILLCAVCTLYTAHKFYKQSFLDYPQSLAPSLSLVSMMIYYLLMSVPVECCAYAVFICFSAILLRCLPISGTAIRFKIHNENKNRFKTFWRCSLCVFTFAYGVSFIALYLRVYFVSRAFLIKIAVSNDWQLSYFIPWLRFLLE